MSISVSLYDVFSNTVPGFLYLYVINEFLKTVGLKYFTFNTTISIVESTSILICAFILGHLFNTFTYHFWYRFSGAHDYSDALQKINKLYPELGITFKSSDHAILFTVIQLKNKQVADRIETERANAIMMRNISFGLFLFGLVQIINFFISKYSLFYMALAIIALILSIVAIRQTSRYYRWFGQDVFNAALVYGTSLEAVLESCRSPISTKKRKQNKKPESPTL